MGTADLATIGCGRLMFCELELEPEAAFMSPNSSTIAGPTVTVSLAPSMPLGSLGSDLPVAAVASAAFLASQRNTGTAPGLAPLAHGEDPPAGHTGTAPTSRPGNGP